MKKRIPYGSTIFLRFLIAYALFGIFGFAATGTFIRSMLLSHLTNEYSERLYTNATQIANSYASDLFDSLTSIESVRLELAVLSDYMNTEIMIINPSGRVVVYSEKVLSSDEEMIIEGFDPTERGTSVYTVGDFYGSYEEKMLSVYSPITAGYKVRAYVVEHVPLSLIEARCDSYLNYGYIELVLLLLLSIMILIFFIELVYIPIRRITDAAEQYAAGNMKYKVSVESDDEIGYLSATLSYMAGEIARTEEDQKKFIANVSHDFRSPLTSIRGYLEAMRDGTIPTERYDKYLEIVINETDRLSKLTNDILALNNLSSSGMLLDRKDFDINDVIRKTSASFGAVCMQRRIHIDLLMTEEEMFVNADAERIKQVLYNLLDNAIKFSQDDGTVTIETTERHSKIFVSVKDQGIGIPKDEIQFVFERFYKSDRSRGKDKKGTGLGLSIVKEIINAHGENINVISTVDVGTEFIFSLPLARSMEE